jgi:hypothetical protein
MPLSETTPSSDLLSCLRRYSTYSRLSESPSLPDAAQQIMTREVAYRCIRTASSFQHCHPNTTQQDATIHDHRSNFQVEPIVSVPLATTHCITPPHLSPNHHISNPPRNRINTRAQMPRNLRRENTSIHNPHIACPIHPPLAINNTTQLRAHHRTGAYRM